MVVALGDLQGHRASQFIDARDRIVAPGFIDAHTHDDMAVLRESDLSFKISQGVTTVITGNCGISAAPTRRDTELPMPLTLVDAPAQQRFATFASYLDALRRQPSSVNVAALVGHTTLRAGAMGALDREASAAEIEAMRVEVGLALETGAIGLSTGTAYPPAACATTEEIIAVGRPLTAWGGLYMTHMRDEGDAVMDSLEETFRIGRAQNVPVVISHHKVQNQANFGRSTATLELIQRTMKHQCVSLDCYPYNASSTMIRVDRGLLQARVLIASSVPHPECAGRDLDDIASQWSVDPSEAAKRLQPGTAVYFAMDEGDVQRILSFESTMVGSDGIPVGDSPHPRLWGTFARVLGHYSRQLGLFPLETAVWKMSGLTAANFGLTGRSALKVGHHADVVVFDPETVLDRATYEQPTQIAAGIDAVIVNGQVSWRDAHHTGARGGQVLRRGHR